MNYQADESSQQIKNSPESQERNKSVESENLKAKDILKKRTFSPGIERSSLASNNRLFSESTAESFNVIHHLSTISSPGIKSKPNFKELKTMLNFNSTMDLSKQSISQTQKKIENFTPPELNEEQEIEKIREKESTSMIINPKVMEVWLNETLADAQHLELKSCYLKPGKEKPISQYGIDRQSLGKCGLNTDLINRIYRGLFVYSVGFYELLNKCTRHTSSKTSLIAAIWRVYSILLEYCCKTDYSMMISEISKTFQDETAKYMKIIEDNLISAQEKEKKLIDKCNDLKASTEAMENKTGQYIKHIEKLNEYIEDLRKRNEEEITVEF